MASHTVNENSVPKIPDLDLAHHRFIVNHGPEEMRGSSLQKLSEAIKSNNMAPFYQLIAQEELKQPIDKSLMASMQSKNAEEIKQLDEKLADAEENLGETEISDALNGKAEYLTKIGDKDKAVSAWRVAFEKTAGIGKRLDIIFTLIRIGMVFNDHDLISRNVEKAKALIEEGGDWDRRNRLKVYEGIHLLNIRDFKKGADLLLSTLCTFTSTELMEYKDFVKYAVLASMISLERVNMKSKVLHAPEILEVLHEIPHMQDYMRSLYECNYARFFKSLAAIEESYLHTSRILFPHLRYYVREMRIKAYTQLLESYRSLTLESMAQACGVSEDFIDQDLSRFIAAGRVNCMIDKVNGVVETNRPDAKNAQYQQCIKQGDLLLNRVQKLSCVINV